MAIEFMLIAMPRSGTTWAANWLTTETTLCRHDLLAEMHYSEWDKLSSKKTLGVADTGIFMFPEWLNQHPARKVILHRSQREIAQSLGMAIDWTAKLHDVKGMHAHWIALFDNPRPIYEFLTGKEFDEERHAELVKIRMQPADEAMVFNKGVMKRIIQEIKEIDHV